MKLYRLVGAAIKESEFAKLATKFEKYGESIKVSTLTKFSGIGSNLRFGEKLAVDVERGLKTGRFDVVKDIYQIEGSVNPQITQILANEVKHLPSYKIGQVEIGVEKMLPTIKDSKFVSSTAPELTEDAVKSSNKMSAVVDFLKGKRFKSLSAGTITLGVTAAAVIIVINQHREKMSGCFRYSVDANGEMKSCKIILCSCKDGQINTSAAELCTTYNPDMNGGKCEETTGYACVNCPPEKVLNDERASIDDENMLNGDETYFYKCNTPSIMDAVGDIVGEGVDRVVKVVNSTVDGATGALNTLLASLKYVIMAVAVAIVFGVVYYIYNTVVKTDTKYQEL